MDLLKNPEKGLKSIEEFIELSVNTGNEGVIVKQLSGDSFYLMNSRSQWLKLKKSIVKSELSDTIDLIPIGAYWGKGRRSGKFSSYLMAVKNHENQTFEAVCKVGTGFSDDFLSSQTTFFQSKFIKKEKDDRFVLNKRFNPDVWI